MSDEAEFAACLLEIGAPPRVLMPNTNSVQQDTQVMNHLSYVRNVDVWYLETVLKFNHDQVVQMYEYIDWRKKIANPYHYQRLQAEQWRNKYFKWLEK